LRTAFINRLSQLAASDPRIMLITGDLGFGVLDVFEKNLPRQYLNAGVAEQNMTAVATGLALEGHIVFTYSIGNFPTLRCLEQLRNDACYHDANVKVVSIGGGFSYGQLGMSHHATEDLSILRALPGITICAPGSAYEAGCMVDALVARPGPGYLRLERGAPDFKDDPQVPCELGKARMIRDGTACTIIATGGVVAEVVAAATLLESQGKPCRVISMHTLKPLDTAAIAAAAAETGGICTVEENTIFGGLGGAVAEVCLESRLRPRRFLRLGIRDRFTSVVGDQDYLRRATGIDRHGIALSVAGLIDSAPISS
jgi:transketolase